MLCLNLIIPNTTPYFRGSLYIEGVFRFKIWFLNAPGLIHGGAYYRNFTVFTNEATFGIDKSNLRQLRLCSINRIWVDITRTLWSPCKPVEIKRCVLISYCGFSVQV